MVRHAPIHRRSGHSDIAICCGRNVLGSSPSTYGGAPLESGHHFESQTIQRIQNVFGRTLRRGVELDEEHKRWHANGVWAGEARNRTKEFSIVMVSPAGKRLWDYWEKVGQEHNWEIPPIDKWPT